MAAVPQSTTAEDVKVINNTLEKWDKESQAVSNLLQYPSLIPVDVRFSYLEKALKETKQKYFVLSAAVGLQSTDVSKQKTLFMNLLLDAVRKNTGPIAARAFTSLEDFPMEIQWVIPFLMHKDETVSYNSRAWLVSKLEKEDNKKIKTMLDSAKIKPEVQKDFLDVLKKHQDEMKAQGWSMHSTGLLAYIPNLSEPQAWMN